MAEWLALLRQILTRLYKIPYESINTCCFLLWVYLLECEIRVFGVEIWLLLRTTEIYPLSNSGVTV